MKEIIVLEPYAEIPYREKWLFENKEALESVLRGLQESEEGKTQYLGSFSSYIDKKQDVHSGDKYHAP